MKKVRTHYDNLKVAKNAPPEIIRAAYKALSQKYHPDKNGGSQNSQRIMKIINDSYNVLSDPEKRKAHDDWINSQDIASNSHHKGSSNIPGSQDPLIKMPILMSGELHKSQLDEKTYLRLKNLMTRNNNGHFAIKLEGVVRNLFWLIILPIWFVFLFYDAHNVKWSETGLYWRTGWTMLFAYLIARNFSWVVQWYSQPFKSYLVATPLYLLKLHLDKVSYWPLTAMSDMKATYNYTNGIYSGTSFTIDFGDMKQNFFVTRKKAYLNLVEHLNRYRVNIKTAASVNDSRYFIDNDIFGNAVKNKTRKKSLNSVVIFTYTSVFILSILLLGLAYFVNDKNDLGIYEDLKTNPFAQFIEKPKFKYPYHRPLTEPKGQVWPAEASYLVNYPKLNLQGLSSITIDNSQNDSDIFVKLKKLAGSESLVVRVFYIPAGDSFKLLNLDAGNYDIRYRDLASGEYARSDPFILEEVVTQAGRKYSNTFLTIYKVRNGNMHMHRLHESDF